MHEDDDQPFDLDEDDWNLVEPRELRVAWEQAGNAIRAGDEATLRQLLIAQPDLASNFHTTESLMHEAAEVGLPGIVKALLEAGIPADIVDELGGTALTEAAWNGHLEVVKLLLDAGADPDAAIEEDGSYGHPHASGRCALFCALYKNHQLLIDMLEAVTSPEMRKRAYVAAEMRREWDASEPPMHSEATIRLFMAAQSGQLKKLLEAIAEGADVNAVLEREASNKILGSTPLTFAAGQGRQDLVEALITAGADPHLVGSDGRTAADCARGSGYSTLEEWLKAAS